MNRRGFLRGLLGVAAAPVVAKVAPAIETLAPKRVVAEPIMGLGRGSALIMDDFGTHVNCRCAAVPAHDADAVLPLYVDNGGDLREASGRLARYMALDNVGIDTRPMRDVSDWATPEARLLVESINGHYGRTAEMLPYLTGITDGSDHAIRDFAAGLKA